MEYMNESELYDYLSKFLNDSLTSEVASGILTFLGIIVVIALIWTILCIIANWIIYKKAGEHGWASIVPFYRSYVEYKITWGMGWIFLLPIVLGCLTAYDSVETIAGVAILVIRVLTCYKKSRVFGHGIGFAVGLFFLEPFFLMALAFGDSRYVGVSEGRILK
jgi:hypothetical protein